MRESEKDDEREKLNDEEEEEKRKIRQNARDRKTKKGDRYKLLGGKRQIAKK